MRIALNLHGFIPGCGGVETYIENLIKALPLVDRSNEYLILCDRLGAKWLKDIGAKFDTRVDSYECSSLRWLFRGALQRTCGYDLLARSLRGVDVDVVHHPLTVLNPPGLPLPAVLTFHDMQQEFYPEFFSAKELKNRQASYRASVREAQAIIAISRHVKSCLVDGYGVSPEKVEVIYHGLSPQFHPVVDSNRLASIMKKYELDRPFMIYPAATWRHKNHCRLLRVLRKLRDQGDFDGQLVLTGGIKDSHGRVLQEIERLALQDTVRWLGFLPFDELPVLYSMAKMMVFPSFFEGFGLPVIEAMATGCPVACSTATSLPEVAGEAARYFDPGSESDMLEVVGQLWNSTSCRNALREKGLARSTVFSWEKAACKTLDVYVSACGRE